MKDSKGASLRVLHGITQRAIHELLHQEYLGHLQHVGLYSGDEIDNIMYKNGTRKNTKLRYRDLPTPDQNDVKQVQWDLIQK